MSSDGSAASSLRVPGSRFDDVPGLQAEDRHLLRGAGDEPAAGSSGDEGVLAGAADIRFPNLSELSGREKIDGLVDHITATAIGRAELEHLRLSAHVKLRDAQLQLLRVPTGVTRNKAAIDEAKRQARPDLAQLESDARWIIARCTEQINRLDRDYDAASRAYTLLAG